jgi:Ca2+-transporting ATPase
MKHLINDKILLQAPHSCEAMTAVTDLCTDMTGTITQDRMTVISGLVGTATTFHSDGHAIGYARGEGQPPLSRRSVDLQALDRCLSPAVQRIFNETITLTCVAIQDIDPNTGDTIFVGSATEVALLHFAKELQWPDFQSTRNNVQILEIIPFSSSRMASGAFVDLGEGRRRLYLKGASEVLSGKCTQHVLIDEDAGVEIQTSPIDHSAESAINQSIASYAEQGLRTISLCYRDFDSWPPDGLWHDRYEVDVSSGTVTKESVLTLVLD